MDSRLWQPDGTMQPQTTGYAAETVRLRTGREVPELLRDLYVERRHSQQEIADAIGVSRSQVREWLRVHGISRDDRAPVDLEVA
jgi:DNA invertase Pin-like site-specific DNA recombinase